MPVFEPIRLPRAYQAVHKALEEAILAGDIAPGEPLPTETELAARFGVTRHTVREGMRVLEQGGLVRRDAGRRLHAALPSHDALAPSASRAMLMQKVSFRELWEVAMRLECCAVELVAPLVDDDLIARLERNVSDTERAIAEGHSIVELDVAFHALLAEATGNRVLLLSREPVSMLFYPSLDKLFSHPSMRDISPRRLVEAHRAIVKALRARDGDEALAWMVRHIADFRRGYEHAGIALDSPVDARV